MKKNSPALDVRAGAAARQALRLVPGGRSTGDRKDGADSLQNLDPVREAIVRRARRRLAAGYYTRPEVVERLVELLWDEFHVR